MTSLSKPGQGWATVFQMKPGSTLCVPTEVHSVSREKLVSLMTSRGESGIVFMEGGVEQPFYDTDREPLFRQDPWFQYLFGVKEPGFLGALDLKTGEATLFMPRHSGEYAVWCGTIHPPAYFQKLYGVAHVLFADEVDAWLEAQAEQLRVQGARFHLLEGVNSDSGLSARPAKLPATVRDVADSRALHHALSTARVTKSPLERTLLEYVCKVASDAHVAVMRAARPEMAEYELEALFRYEIYAKGGSRCVPYSCISACGPNAATLHYGHAAAPNDRTTRASDCALLDMGALYHGYCADITCSFPLSGRFDQCLTSQASAVREGEYRVLYEGVLRAQEAVYARMVPGALWPALHLAAEREVLLSLLALGLVQGDIDEMQSEGVGAVFLPCGLGHLIGCDVHDVGGYIAGTPARSERAGLNRLRTARALEVGMVLTVEPGVYFIDALLDAALACPARAKYLCAPELARFRGAGGVRLEDVVWVSEHGPENLTLCPRTVQEVEDVMAGGQWPPKVDSAPQLKRKWVKLSDDCRSMVALELK